MTTVPLFDPTAEPFAWHRVRAPGGWERWTFDARADDESMALNVCFFTGYPTPAYRKAYRQFMSNPTRNRPPVPMDSMCVIVRGTITGRAFVERLPVRSTQFREITWPRRIEMGDHDILTHDSGMIDLKAGKHCRVELELVQNGDQLKADGLVFHDGSTLKFHGQAQKSYAFGLSLFNDDITV